MGIGLSDPDTTYGNCFVKVIIAQAKKEHIANREQNVYILGFIDWGAGEDSPALSPLRIPVIKGAPP